MKKILIFSAAVLAVLLLSQSVLVGKSRFIFDGWNEQLRTDGHTGEPSPALVLINEQRYYFILAHDAKRDRLFFSLRLPTKMQKVFKQDASLQLQVDDNPPQHIADIDLLYTQKVIAVSLPLKTLEELKIAEILALDYTTTDDETHRVKFIARENREALSDFE